MNSVYDHPEYRALLAAILANPDDNLPRLVLADWLQEHGEDERAELIRIECEMARSPDRAACDRCRKAWSRRLFSSYPVEMGWCDNCRTSGPFWPDVERSLALRRRRVDLRCRWQRPWTDADERAGLNAYSSRGFVTRVSAPLAVLIGGECDRCLRSRHLNWHDGRVFLCPTCHGTGRTAGVLPALVRREPVELVTVTDLEPPGSTRTRWELPYDVFAMLKGDCFSSEAEAMDAASAALLAWARSQPVSPSAHAVG